MRTGNGTKGERLYDWAVIDVRADEPRRDRTPGTARF